MNAARVSRSFRPGPPPVPKAQDGPELQQQALALEVDVAQTRWTVYPFTSRRLSMAGTRGGKQ
jgi:hypothetical protein